MPHKQLVCALAAYKRQKREDTGAGARLGHYGGVLQPLVDVGKQFWQDGQAAGHSHKGCGAVGVLEEGRELGANSLSQSNFVCERKNEISNPGINTTTGTKKEES